MSTLVIATRRLFGAEPAASRRAPQFALLVATAALAAAVLQAGAGTWLASAWRNPAISAALGATLITAFATGLGALPVLFLRQLSDRARDTLLGFGAGVMLAASFFSLLAPAQEAGAAQTGSAASGGMIGAGMITAAYGMLPWGLAFASGAMLFVVIHEIIPETHRNGNERVVTLGLIAGFIVMTLSDTMLA